MPDASGNFKGITVPRLPWLRDGEETPPVTPEEDEAFDAIDPTNRDPVPFMGTD